MTMVGAAIGAVGGVLVGGMMSGGGAEAPDTQAVADASVEAQRLANELGYAQLDESKRQYDLNRSVIDPIVQSQIAQQDETLAQGRDYYDYLSSTYRPLEQQIVADARAFDTEAAREQQARAAAADTGRAFTMAQQANERAMASMGVNPNSGRFQGQQRAAGLQLAAQRANAMTGARERADAMGRAMKMDAAGLGRNLPGASTGAYTAALNAGNSAASNTMAPGQQYMSGLTAGANTIMNGQQLGLQGQLGVLDAQTSVYQTNMANQSAMMQGLGSLAGTLGGAYIMRPQ